MTAAEGVRQRVSMQELLTGPCAGGDPACLLHVVSAS